MGRERYGGRQQIFLCVAILIFLIPLACSLGNVMTTKVVDTVGDEARAHLAVGKTYLGQGEFGSALKENAKVISLAGRNVPADEALFYIGLIYAHPANPTRDYGKSIVSFRRLIKEHPGSSLLEEAKTMVGLLQENDKLNHTVNRSNNRIDELKQENDKLNRTADRLNNLIDELKQVDIGVEQKKRDKTK